VPPAFRPTRLAFALALLMAAAGPIAQAEDAPAEPPANIPAELSDDARRAYAQSLKEVREMIARKDYAAAAAKVDALLAGRPREAQARFLKGVIQTARGETDAAILTYRALTEDYPELPEPYNNLAVLYAQKGDYNGARLALETAVTAAPDWAVARENLGDIYARLAAENYDRAAALDKANKTAPAKLVLARQLLVTKTPN
jgi:Flp pilus assembly protein TadD